MQAAFGEVDGYGTSLRVGSSVGLRLWGHPVTRDDITSIFLRYLAGDISALPWSEEALSAESTSIIPSLRRLNLKGWWTVASQPAVDAACSSDPVVGWGPRNGFVWQKAFVELFVPKHEWNSLRERLEKEANIAWMAGNARGDFESSNYVGRNVVTWGTFPGKE